MHFANRVLGFANRARLEALERRALLSIAAPPDMTSWTEFGQRWKLQSSASAIILDTRTDVTSATAHLNEVAETSIQRGIPPAPPLPDLTTDSGVSDSDNLTNFTRPIIDVVASEAGTLRLFVDGDVNRGGSLRVPGPGTYEFVAVGPLGFDTAVVPTGLDAYALAAAYVNNDRKLDLLTCNPGSRTLTVHFGNGDGTFMPTPVTTIRSSGPFGVATADFNRDGRIDVVLSNNSATVHVLFGQGNGTFVNERTLPLLSGNFVLNVTAGDVNGDSNADVLAAERGTNTVRVILGNGDGTFQPGVSYTAGGNNPFDPQIADMNGDSHPDILVSNHAVDSITILLNNGNGTFQGPRSAPTAFNPTGFAAADYDRDGKLDVMVSENGAHRAHFLKGNGDGTLTPGEQFVIDFNNQGGVAGDFNLDGRMDYATTAVPPAEVNVLLGNGDGTFRPYLRAGTGASVFELIGADFNNDGQKDLAFADFTNDGVTVVISAGGHLADGMHTAYATLQDLLGNMSGPSPTLSFEVDTAKPNATSGEFRYDAVATQEVGFVFNEDVEPTLSTADLSLLNLTTGTVVPATHMALSYTPGTNAGTFTFPGYVSGVLPDGDYRATLLASGITDLAGNPLESDSAVEFYFLQADANRDRKVGPADFNILMSNFGRPNRTFSQGDFNYNGMANLEDFDILASRFGTVLAAPARRPLFGSNPLGESDRTDDSLSELLA